MDLICFLHPGWDPLIRPAEATRPWMDATPETFAYRCLPLNIANAHGWEILSPGLVEACWHGGSDTRDVVVRNEPGTPAQNEAVSAFGQGVLTFHIQALFKTPPGWDLFVMGSPNRAKDGIAPLSGIIETDWSPYTFTMNWRFTRRNHWVKFEKNEPICFIFPVQRGVLERMEPKVVHIDDDPELAENFRLWTASRNEFLADQKIPRPRLPTEKWQKKYFRGVTMTDDKPKPFHRTRVRVKPFAAGLMRDTAAETLTLDEDELARLLAEARAGASAEALAATMVGMGVDAGLAARVVDAGGTQAVPVEATPLEV